MDPDTVLYRDAVRRIYRSMQWLASGAVLFALVLRGWRVALAVLLGAVAAYLNFSWLHQMVDALGPGAPPPRKRFVVLLAFRYVLLGAAGYVIVRVFGMNVVAAVLGLFVPVAAVLLEIIYELVHART